MFAVLKTGGKQYKVIQGDLIDVEKLKSDVGDMVTL
ncbi:MAG: bL21 family ribosomal protein, partial [Nitrospinaceae bacterium]